VGFFVGVGANDRRSDHEVRLFEQKGRLKVCPIGLDGLIEKSGREERQPEHPGQLRAEGG